MKTINILKMNEKVYYEKLENGLEIYMYPKNDVSNNYVTFTTRFGSMHNEFIPYNQKKMIKVPNGIAHFLEHKLFAQENGLDPSLFFAKSGTNYNASTSSKYTTYLFEGPNNLEENLNFLLDFVQSPYFTDENVLVEKGIIAEEINMYKDSPMDILYEKINKNVFINSPLKEPIAGEISDINKITKEILYDCYNTFYYPSNMFLVITGNFDPIQIVKLIKENQAKKQFRKVQEIKLKKYVEPDKVFKEKEIINLNTAVPKIAYNIKIPVANLEKYTIRKLYYYISILFNTLFGDTSPLVYELKEKGIISNNIYIEILNANDHILVTLLNETKNKDILIENIENTLDNIKITKKEFERKKKVYISNEIFLFNNIVTINDFLLDNIIFENKIEENIINILNDLSIQELQSIVTKLDLSNKSIVIVEKK